MSLHRLARRTLALCSVAAVSGVAGATPASADTTSAPTIYVAASGDDAAAGTADNPLKTLGAALSRARGGERVQLGAGVFALAQDEAPRTTDVTVVGAGPSQTQVAGMNIYGGQHLRFSSIKFTAAVRVQGHPVKHAAQPATAVLFTASEFTASSGACLTIREGARDISVTGSSIHDCASGIVGPGNPYTSRGIVIDHNSIERITSDAIQFGAWSAVRISNNTIRSIYDPSNAIHNDGIQLTGNSAGVEISSNWISGSRNQLVFIQDAIGPIDDVAVVNNVLRNAGAVALQSQGATHARFVNNTIWDAKDGGLWLRAGYVRDGVSIVPTDTVLSNNLSTTIRLMEGAATSAAAGNVVLCPSKYSGVTVPAGAACVTDPGYVNAAACDYRLAPGSAARPLGSWLALPALDFRGVRRTGPVPGAYN